MKKILTILLVSITVIGYAQIRIIQVVPSTNTITIKNFGGSTVNISNYRLCSLIKYTSNLMTGITVNSGDLNLTAGSEVEIVVPGGASSSWQNLASEADLGLYLDSSFGGFGSSAAMVDFLQWGSGGHGRESIAVAKGIWVAGKFISGNAPYTYTGDGTENGTTFWTHTNADPTNISIDNSTINENETSGYTIGTFSSTDIDVDDIHTYSLATGTGDTDNASFTIDGQNLKSNAVFDFETEENYSIRVQTDDGNGGTFQESFSITVLNINDDPTNLSLSNQSLSENLPINTSIGNFSTDDEDTADSHSYSLVFGTGDTDNASFIINGSTIEAGEIFNFEVKDSYSIRVRTDDGNEGILENSFTITINDENESPTDIILSSNTILENSSINTVIGALTTSDEDVANTHTYTLVSGLGDDDNASFVINGSDLETAEIFDFENKSSYSIRIQTDDANGGTYQESLAINISNDNDVPTEVALDNQTILENEAIGTNVGTLSTVDEDVADNHTYTLVTGTGDTDNSSFTIATDMLQSNEVFDIATKSAYSVRIQSNDGNGGIIESSFAITILAEGTNIAPTDISLTNSNIDENQAIASVIGTLTTIDANVSDVHTYALIAGAGDEDNASFQLSGNSLQTSEIFNFEIKNSYNIRIQTDDEQGGTFQKEFTIAIQDLNDTPSRLTIDESSIVENEPISTTIGTFTTEDEDISDTHTYSLVTGSGDTDNSSFTISVDLLHSKEVFDFAVKTSYSIRVHSNDGNGGTIDEVFVINITEEIPNVAPNDISLTNSSINENQAIASVIGTLTTIDANVSDVHTYALIAGAGDEDNASFQLSGNSLQTSEIFNFEIKNSYNIRIQTDDGQGGAFQKEFIIAIQDLNDTPSRLAIDESSIVENEPISTTIGTFTTEDEDTSDTHTYSLVTGTGDTDNSSFTISADLLQSKEVFDFAVKTSYSIRVHSNDGNGGTIDEVFVINITEDIPNVAPNDISLSTTSIEENSSIGSEIGTLTSADANIDDSHLYSFVAGLGDTHNSSFQINGDKIISNILFNFEDLDVYSIRIKSDDSNGGTFEKILEINVKNVNESPKALDLSNLLILENESLNSVIGTFATIDEDVTDTHTYSLVIGDGDTDNNSFQIDGLELLNTEVFNFEQKDAYTIRVQTEDALGLTFQQTFSITISDDNDIPLLINVSKVNTSENQVLNSTIVTLSTTDEDIEDTHAYSLVSGEGDIDNASFTISGNSVLSSEVFNFEEKEVYGIRIRTEDDSGADFEQSFVISIEDVNDPPTDIEFAPSILTTFDPIGTLAGCIFVIDEDATDTHTYTLVAGTGDDNNSLFTIQNIDLLTNALLDEVTTPLLKVRMRATDSQGEFTEMNFEILIDIVTGSLENFKNAKIKIYPNPFNEEIVLELSSRLEDLKVMIYSLDGSLVHQSKILTATTDKIAINAKSLKPGLYYLKLLHLEDVLVNTIVIKQ